MPPNRIDLLTSVDGVDFEEAWATRVPTRFGEQKAWLPSPEVLMRNKRASDQPQDLLDLKAPEQALALARRPI